MSRLPKIAYPTRKTYPSDLSDTEWDILEPLLPAPQCHGRPRAVDLREIINAIFYVQRAGCQWEMLPHDFPPYSTVYRYHQKWLQKGLWEKLINALCQTLEYTTETKKKIIDITEAQSIRSTEESYRSQVLSLSRRLKSITKLTA